jgi:hypothetical protein
LVYLVRTGSGRDCQSDRFGHAIGFAIIWPFVLLKPLAMDGVLYAV